jgi:hypothetical protein
MPHINHEQKALYNSKARSLIARDDQINAMSLLRFWWRKVGVGEDSLG